jgi:hypothetical protein
MFADRIFADPQITERLQADIRTWIQDERENECVPPKEPFRYLIECVNPQTGPCDQKRDPLAHLSLRDPHALLVGVRVLLSPSNLRVLCRRIFSKVGDGECARVPQALYVTWVGGGRAQ